MDLLKEIFKCFPFSLRLCHIKNQFIQIIEFLFIEIRGSESVIYSTLVKQLLGRVFCIMLNSGQQHKEQSQMLLETPRTKSTLMEQLRYSYILTT